MTGRSIFVAAMGLALGAACAGAGVAEVPPPAPTVEAPAPAAPVHKAGKAGKRGKPADATGCPEGVIAAPGWPGEWPSPVVDVVKAVTLKVRAEPCSRPSLDCEVPAGIYHPWSDIVAEYVTVRSIDKYTVNKTLDVDELHCKAGQTIEVTQEFGEGYCGYRVAGKDVTAPCPEMLGDALTRVPGPEREDKELFSVSCGAKTGWVEANDALLALPGIRPGSTPEYGKVGPGSD